MSIKKMSLLVSSFLLFFLVASIVINTMVVVRKQEKEKVSSKITFEIHPDKMVSSYNFVEVAPTEEEKIEEEEEINTRDIKVSPDLINNKKEIKFRCNYDNINFDFNCNKIYKKIQDCQEQEKNAPIKKSPKEISLLLL